MLRHVLYLIGSLICLTGTPANAAPSGGLGNNPAAAESESAQSTLPPAEVAKPRSDFDRVGIDERRLQALLEELRCMVCQNQSLYDSQTDLANDLKARVIKGLQAGWSDRKIKDDLADKYGQFILYRPPFNPATWLLWLLPFVLSGLAAVGLGWYLYRQSRRRSSAQSPSSEP